MFEVKDEHGPIAPPKWKMEIVSVEMWISWFQLGISIQAQAHTQKFELKH